MKKTLFITLILLTVGNIFATFQSIDTAKTVANNYFSAKSIDHIFKDSSLITQDGVTYGYIFNYSPIGFIIVSADNIIEPVIAYSLINNFDENKTGDAMFLNTIRQDLQWRYEIYKNDNEKQMKSRNLWNKYATNWSETKDFQQWPPAGSTLTDGWVETRWSQTGVYNRFCPLDNSNQRSVVGCVATAMAMIVDYHKYIGTLNFTDADDFDGGWNGEMHIDEDYEQRDYPPFPELNVYLDDLRIHYQQEENLTTDDLAALNFACGIAVHMLWSSQGSGAWVSDVATSLINKFDFSSAYWLENNGYSFYETLQEDMINMRPAEFAIYDQNWNNGHAIICDGYNTDDYYHLNYGWGDSNNTCWYLLPEGMPANYSIVYGSVVNIEGGEAPIQVNGNVSVSGVSPEGTYILLEGDRSSEIYVEDSSGDFDIPAIFPGTYTATALLQRAFYQQFEVTIDENNTFIQFNLDNFDAITGNISAEVPTEGCKIEILQDDETIANGIVQPDGTYSIPDILPGNYHLRASLAGGYFAEQDIYVDIDHLNFDLNLENYEGDLGISYAKGAMEPWHLIADYEISCGIKLCSEDIDPYSNDIITKVKFKSPISNTEGSIIVQVWNDNILLTEKNADNFSSGEWKEVELDSYIPIDPDKNYFVGYRIISDTGDWAFHDYGPHIDGKGAFFKTGTWIELPSTNNFNFCIEAIISSQNYAIVQGNVNVADGNGDVRNAVIFSGYNVSQPNDLGDYELTLKPDTYNMTADLFHYNCAESYTITLNQNDILTGYDFTMTYSTGSDENEINALSNIILRNYPNPFNPTTTIEFSIKAKDINKPIQLEIFNLKGQKIKEFQLTNCKSGLNSIVWTGKSASEKDVGSGIYFYKIIIGDYSQTRRMLMIK